MPEEQMNDGLNSQSEQKELGGAEAGDANSDLTSEMAQTQVERDGGLNDADIKHPQKTAFADEQNQVQAERAEELVERKPVDPIRNLDFLLDIPMELTVEIGRAKLEIKELLTLGPGSVVELDKLAGEPLDVYVNDRLIARGEVVVVNEKFGLRLTEAVSKKERLENLK